MQVSFRESNPFPRVLPILKKTHPEPIVRCQNSKIPAHEGQSRSFLAREDARFAL
jgi:hypothetical protein